MGSLFLHLSSLPGVYQTTEEQKQMKTGLWPSSRPFRPLLVLNPGAGAEKTPFKLQSPPVHLETAAEVSRPPCKWSGNGDPSLCLKPTDLYGGNQGLNPRPPTPKRTPENVAQHSLPVLGNT